MASKWSTEEELFPIYKPPPGDYGDESPERKKKHKKHKKKKHKKSSKSESGEKAFDIKSDRKNGKGSERKRHETSDGLKKVDYSKEQHQYSSIGYEKFSTATTDLVENTTGVLTKGVGKLTRGLHIDDRIQNGQILYSATEAVEKGFSKVGNFSKDSVAKTVDVFTGKHIINDPYHKSTNHGGKRDGSVSLDDSATSRAGENMLYAATGAVEKGMSKFGDFTKDSVAKTMDVFTGNQRHGDDLRGRSNFQAEKIEGVDSDNNAQPVPPRNVGVVTTGVVMKGFESTTEAVFKGLETTSEAFSKGIDTTTGAITKSLETLTGRKNEVGVRRTAQKPDGNGHGSTFVDTGRSSPINTFSQVVDRVQKQQGETKLESFGSFLSAEDEFGELIATRNATNDNDETKTNEPNSSLNIEQITRAKKFSNAFVRRHDESAAANHEHDDELANGKLPPGLKQIAGTAIAAKGLGRLVHRRNESGRNEAKKKVDSDVLATEVDGCRVENVQNPKIIPVQANFAVMYWKGGFGIPENGSIQISDSDLIFTGMIVTKLNFKLKDISIEKVSKIGVLRSNGFRINVVTDMHTDTGGNSSKESHLFSVVLKDIKEVMDTIQAAIDIFKPSANRISDVSEASDESDVSRDDLATIHTVTTLAKREVHRNTFFANVLRSIILPFRRLLKPANFEEAVRIVHTSVNELDDIRLKSFPGGVKSLEIAKEIEAIRKSLGRIEKIQNSVPTTVEKRSKRM